MTKTNCIMVTGIGKNNQISVGNGCFELIWCASSGRYEFKKLGNIGVFCVNGWFVYIDAYIGMKGNSIIVVKSDKCDEKKIMKLISRARECANKDMVWQ